MCNELTILTILVARLNRQSHDAFLQSGCHEVGETCVAKLSVTQPTEWSRRDNCLDSEGSHFANQMALSAKAFLRHMQTRLTRQQERPRPLAHLCDSIGWNQNGDH